uniref:RBR-type E3 ubiquitin transferase n=1 Tax=Aplanochytrium stocchinoi TaxID=215587 RepID=A0A7S3PJG6_9STRA|eukprot:CAMPEP_0204830992 /NCGR_PEP_ID=MMETSP1346-20131115/9602_1 /ASSEMBLY_ACC=CAM_ASM_000771 /TAXON_ID=215587 /ORGANISM="Aplanochytrium stocchinoi, Strain GSBS06" /LENGTH=562 /DNA_ID=CAMNT_0051961645 /DNA_START=177 /DNA_END=1865 /DNA_ORIENTATION=-
MSSEEDDEYYYYSDEDEYQQDEDEGKDVKEGTKYDAEGPHKSQLGHNGDRDKDEKANNSSKRSGSSSSIRFRNSSTLTEYQVLSMSDLLESQKKLINDVATVLDISNGRANVLLMHFRWNKEKLYDTYYGDPEGTCLAAGALENDSLNDARKPDDMVLCPVLFEEYRMDDTYSMGCTCKEHPKEHRFSLDAWREYLKSKVEDGRDCIFSRCPMDSCSCVISPAVWEFILGGKTKNEQMNEALKRYQRFLLSSYVDINKHIKWCPSAGCDRAISASGAVSQVVCDGCNFRFCFRCGVEAHSPASCKTLATWLEKCNNESETANWIIANTKTCPKCSIRIEKNQGCNHMICRVCKEHFCWVCMGPWSEHGTSTGGFYNCNKFTQSNNNTSDEAEKAKQELDRYLHYYQRYALHQQAAQFAARQRAQAEERMIKLQGQSGSGWIDVQFLDQAVEQLIECRRVLKYTYAFAYYLPSGPKKTLFEHNQSDLESYTEKLSELSEKPIEDLDRTEVINYTRVTGQFMRSLLESVENEGMVELATEQAILSTKQSCGTTGASKTKRSKRV